ncbi:unnamed protein product [Leptidea sinapis]|uniref:PAN2-PAN3 deadenylation complex catalytic subunit PAN2 N-terminal domain-containing protein n=1 Tax=Leptidea sinapis TaxID=189913 RepID=A0A5E4QD43_9NEOP|nr:unnamed protein product [Leptidea sinapis]
MAYRYPDMGSPNDSNDDAYVSDFPQPYGANNPDAEYVKKAGVLVDEADEFGVTAITFDKYEELIWMGHAGGLVTSFYGPDMKKYTSFRVHATEAIRDIVTFDEGIYVLSKTQLRHQIRRGIPKFTHTSMHMSDMQCLFQAGRTKLLMGGHQNTLIEFDVAQMYETVVPITEDGCAVLRSGGGSLVACGSANGMVNLRDIRTPAISTHIFRAHTGCLSDLDMQGNMLISSGFTDTDSAQVPEQFVVVWDVRHLNGTGAWTIPVASPPLLLHFLPSVSGKATALSSDGHVTILHVNEPSEADKQSVFQVDTQGSFCSVMDVSSTSQAFVFGDEAGHLHLFSSKHNDKPVFNNFSRETEFATPFRIPRAGFNDPTFRIPSVPCPPLASGTMPFNVLPDEFFRRVFRRPKPIDPELLRTIRMQGPIGYAPNPNNRTHNLYPYIDDNLDDLNKSRVLSVKPPKEYQKIVIVYNKNEPNAELESLNKTGLPGIQATLPNSYCNPMLQDSFSKHWTGRRAHRATPTSSCKLSAPCPRRLRLD